MEGALDGFLYAGEGVAAAAAGGGGGGDSTHRAALDPWAALQRTPGATHFDVLLIVWCVSTIGTKFGTKPRECGNSTGFVKNGKKYTVANSHGAPILYSTVAADGLKRVECERRSTRAVAHASRSRTRPFGTAEQTG